MANGTSSWAPVLLAVLCAGAVATVVILGLQLTFFSDDWYMLLQRPGLASRPGLDSLLTAHNGNIVVLFAVTYRAIGWLFGLHSQLPYRLFLGLWVAALGIVVYLIVRSRLGTAVAVACAAVTLFLGSAWEALLSFAGFGDFASVALGLGALLLLERDTPRRNAVACLLLVLSVLTFSIGVPFVVGAAVVIVLRRSPRQAWIPALPAGLFALWWTFYGVGQSSHFSVANLRHLPKYLMDSFSAGLAAITGFHGSSEAATLRAGHIVLLIIVLATPLVWFRRGRPRFWLLVYLGVGLCFWGLTGTNYYLGREPTASRYLVFDAPIAIVILAELFCGVRLMPVAKAVLLAGAAGAIALNATHLEAGFDFMQLHADYARADLGALRLLDGRASPDLQLLASIAHDQYLSGVTPARYFAVTRSNGAPAYFSPRELAAAPVSQRVAADSVLVSAGGITLQQAPRPDGLGCTNLRVPGGARRGAASLTAGSVLIENRSAGPLVVEASRFAPAARARPISFLAARGRIRLTVVRDGAQVPWQVVLLDPNPAGALAKVCPSGT